MFKQLLLIVALSVGAVAQHPHARPEQRPRFEQRRPEQRRAEPRRAEPRREEPRRRREEPRISIRIGIGEYRGHAPRMHRYPRRGYGFIGRRNYFRQIDCGREVILLSDGTSWLFYDSSVCYWPFGPVIVQYDSVTGWYYLLNEGSGQIVFIEQVY
jgi:hypothetical protein